MITKTLKNIPGTGYFWGLSAVFVAMRLLGAIDWPWCWVLAPLWIPAIPIATITIAYCITILLTLKK